ncbi:MULTISPECIES: peptide chain release factor N(5)-glutamine methyltransferase [unclassified Cryobacterium]|uniref:peptide chain release factor N(5)-glutamine methyltransferase n=1 Tax=unclassified Cryobacterium TaxID=2649013 RepID=UPI001068FB23|nr:MULTISPECIES: peptide chain release factor N(5)-glutamine methyltransferase [unclassified Cryobacterium]TFC58877.1 peptide chain release factor N(5)-glutamine methyltransferase [Cryobacterium sp. TMB3-1-2]TFC70511.1 peptide chain release factor N(5)-glutamine methyltransferase [Cryobacterium sp. TMB3-15]TFC73919.1 peptide chain release factor N(5)-glutamine methyltransferase [Cryobacterium sp. TMB3-10]TFD42089.1 peptide chain release factor N(5)-glutamine methyltransferase [Cryobacterium sp.
MRAFATSALTGAGIEGAEIDADLLIGHVLGQSRGQVQAGAIMGTVLSDTDAAAIVALVQRREKREPLQHITGRAPFRGLELNVGPGVFVPRPETEGVAQLAIDALRSMADPEPIGVDLGTGSGAIALALATEVPHARVYACENSADAFPWTSRNFTEVAAENATLVFADLAGAFTELNGTVSVVVSNPPYIPVDAIPRDPEVRLFDPAHALFGGPDGLDIVRLVSQTGLRLLRAGGVLVIEHGELQGAEIRALLDADGWRATATHRDLTTRDRSTTALRP